MTGDSDAIVYALRGVQHGATEVQYRELLEFAVDVEPDAELFGAAPNPDLIDDRPPSVRAGIRREDDRQ